MFIIIFKQSNVKQERQLMYKPLRKLKSFRTFYLYPANLQKRNMIPIKTLKMALSLQLHFLSDINICKTVSAFTYHSTNTHFAL